MLQFVPVSEDNTIVIRASGKLTHEDYQAFLPQLEAQFDNTNKVSLLLELENFSGWDLEAMKDDFSFGKAHLEDFDRIAIVGDKLWERWMALMAKPFVGSAGGEVRYFDRENLQSAWDWLREKQNLEKASEQLTPYTNILCAVDFSAHSKHAAKRAIELTRLYKARLSLLHVAQEVDPYQFYPGEITFAGGRQSYDLALLELQNKQIREEAEERMQAFVTDLGANIPIHTEVTSGDKRSIIVSYLEAQNSDLAIFGSRKKKGIEKLHGTLSHYIHNHARCEILVAPLVDLNSVDTFN